MLKSTVHRLSVMPRIDYTDDEMRELRQTFQAYDTNGSGLLTPRRAIKCVTDLMYNFHESVIMQILSDQNKERSQVALDFNDFVSFIDVIGAMDAFIVERLTDLIEGAPAANLVQAYVTTSTTDPQQLINCLCRLVTLGPDDSFKFASACDVLGYEDDDDGDIEQKKHDLEPAPPRPHSAEPSSSKPAEQQRAASAASRSVQLKTDFLQVPQAATHPTSASPEQESKHRHASSIRFDMQGRGTRQFHLPKLSIATETGDDMQPPPLRTMSANLTATAMFRDRFTAPTAADSISNDDDADAETSQKSLDPDRLVAAETDNGVTSSSNQALIMPSPVNEFDEEDIAYVHDAFATFLTVFDREHDGAIAVSELGAALRMLGLDPSEDQIQDLFTRADADRNGMIDFGEFCLYYKQMLQSEFKDGIPLLHIKAIFAKADSDNDGEVTREEFAHILRKQFLNLSSANVEELLDIADSNADGIIDFEEFVSFLNRSDKNSQIFARKLFRAHLPSPIEHLTAFGKMPSNFRPSSLANLQYDPVSIATSHIAPILDSDSLGLEFRGLRSAEGSTALAPIMGEVCVQIELIGAQGIPIPSMNRHRIAARRARIALFSGDKPISCQYLVRAFWNPQEEDRWKFAFPTSSMHVMVAKSSQKQPFLLVELSLLVQDESNRSCSEMTCGFANIDLGCEMLIKTVTEIAAISGGTFKAKAAINQDEILARRDGWRRLTSLFKGKPLPTVTLKIGPIADARLKEHSYRMPNNLVAPLASVEVVHLFLEILADMTVRCARPFVSSTSHPQQDAPIRIFLDHIVSNVDSLTALADAWADRKKRLSRTARKKLSHGTPNDFVKSEFRNTILRLWPALSSILLPDPDVGQTDHERLSLLLHCSKEDIFEQFSTDGMATQTNGTPSNDISKSLIFRPFHTEEIAFSYDMYQPYLNPFGSLEREIRENCQIVE